MNMFLPCDLNVEEAEGKDNDSKLAVDKTNAAQANYFKDLREGKMLDTLKIRVLPKDAFQIYMKQIGKLGGQNKVPRLANDRKIADKLTALFLK